LLGQSGARDESEGGQQDLGNATHGGD
jgi:hypothetical protein